MTCFVHKISLLADFPLVEEAYTQSGPFFPTFPLLAQPGRTRFPGLPSLSKLIDIISWGKII